MIEPRGSYNKKCWIYFLRGICLVLSLNSFSVCDAKCSSGIKELWAYGKPSTEVFTDKYVEYLSSDKGGICRWIITASEEDQIVKLSFPSYKLKRNSNGKFGDCVEIYDGENAEAEQLADICDSEPGTTTYESSKSSMFVVYRRGAVEGERELTLKYSAKEVLSKDDIIRIAICVGGILAAVSFTYFILRVTKCCQCLQNNNNKRSSNAESSPEVQHESARLHVPVTTVDPEHGAPHLGIVTMEDTAPTDSDSDSLPEVNEPPPSYESLYLTEEGIPPPDYTPPLHKERHPPRRVHTFN